MSYDEEWLNIQKKVFDSKTFRKSIPNNNSPDLEFEISSFDPPCFDDKILNCFNIQTNLYCEKLGIALPKRKSPNNRKPNIDEINLL